VAKELAVESQQCTVSRFLFNREFLTKNNMTAIPHPPYFALFPRLKTKLKGRHFDKAEVIQAASQAVLNTLTEHEIKDKLKKLNSVA
jgi:hypothetical protein